MFTELRALTTTYFSGGDVQQERGHDVVRFHLKALPCPFRNS